MHPRNRYNKPPDFGSLAKSQPSLRPFLIETRHGHTINFKEPAAVKALTEALLAQDFGLLVELPIDRLIPTVPQKLNYLHWIEDLLACLSIPIDQPHMVDIGTGASAIYALLGCRLHDKWAFTATEVDPSSCAIAQDNVKTNALDSRIAVIQSPSPSSIFQGVVPAFATSPEADSSAPVVAATMCNPPFYTPEQLPSNRSGHRPSAKTVNTATSSERATEGGEVAFVRLMIEESQALHNRVAWFTSMVGKKNSLAPLKQALAQCGCTHVCQTSFVQGKTHRWAIAWSYLPQHMFKTDEDSVAILTSSVSFKKHQLQAIRREGAANADESLYADNPSSADKSAADGSARAGKRPQRIALPTDGQRQTAGRPATKRSKDVSKPPSAADINAWKTAKRLEKVTNIAKPLYTTLLCAPKEAAVHVRQVLTNAKPSLLHEQGRATFDACAAAYRVFVMTQDWVEAPLATAKCKADALCACVMVLYPPWEAADKDDTPRQRDETRCRLRVECKGGDAALARILLEDLEAKLAIAGIGSGDR